MSIQNRETDIAYFIDIGQVHSSWSIFDIDIILINIKTTIPGGPVEPELFMKKYITPVLPV